MGNQENKRQVHSVLSRARALGCTVEHCRSGHYKITLPDGQKVFCSATPSDNRGIKATISLLRRKGVLV